MNPSTTAYNTPAATVSSSPGVNNPAFWERFWLTSGIQFVGLFVLTYFIYPNLPPVGASPDVLAAFYTGDRTRILLASAFAGLNILNLLWFAAALRASLTEMGQEGWGAAATASSAAFGGLYTLFVTIVATLAYSAASGGNTALTKGLNDLAWGLLVLSSFPRAMLIMSGTFGLWRAGVISNSLFSMGLGAVIAGVLGGMTWLSGFWAPDGVYSRLLSPVIGLLWILVVSRSLLSRRPATHPAW
jgi:hypothetical protein